MKKNTNRAPFLGAGVVSFAVFLLFAVNIAYGGSVTEETFLDPLSAPTATPRPITTPEPTFTPTPPANPCSALFVKATAYNLNTLTFTETRPNIGTIAVDPRVIPLGSLIFVPEYGFGVAKDIGEGIIGNHIDVWLPTRKEALDWGVKNLEVRVCNEPAR